MNAKRARLLVAHTERSPPDMAGNEKRKGRPVMGRLHAYHGPWVQEPGR